MNKVKLKNIATAAVPLIFLISLILLFGYVASIYVRCTRRNCEPITQNLNRVLLEDDPKAREFVAGESPENAQKKAIATSQRTASIYSGRLTFIFIALSYFLSCLVAAVVASIVLIKSLRRASSHATRWFLVAVGLALAFGISLYYRPDAFMTILDPLFSRTLFSDLNNIKNLMVSLNSFGFAAALLLTFAICAVLYDGDAASKPDDLKQLSLRMKHLQATLYVATVMLIVGVLLIRSMYTWSLAFILPAENAIKAAQTFFSGLLTAEGGYFTLILAAVYLPAAFILRRRAESVPGLPETESEKESLLQNHNLAFSFTKSLPRVAAILGPILIGPIGEMFGRLSSS